MSTTSQFLQDHADGVLALGKIAGKIELHQLANLDAEERRAWAEKIARQLTGTVTDWTPPEPAPAATEVPGLVDPINYKGERRAWIEACNRYLADRHAGRVAVLPIGVPRAWLREHHPAGAALVEQPDPWHNSRAYRAGAAEPTGDREAGGLDAE